MTAGNFANPAAAALRCPRCGRKIMSASRCSACGVEIALTTAPLVVRAPASIQLQPRGGFVSTLRGDPRRAMPRTALSLSQQHFGGEVSGRILIVSAPVNEPADPDHWKWLAIPAWGLVLLASPFVAGILTWMTAGFLATALVVFICIAVLRYIFSDHLLMSWQFVAALRGRHVVETVPNVAIRLRAADDREVQLRVKGRLSGGGLVEGDRIRAAGQWRAGIFHATRLHCDRTGAIIVPIQPNSMVPAICGVVILFAAVLWLTFAGWPWVRAKLEHTRRFPSRLQTELLTR